MKKRFLCAVLATLLTLSSVMVSAATVTMYAQDGRTTEVDSSKVAAYKKVGWYENKSDVMTFVRNNKGYNFREWTTDTTKLNSIYQT